MIRITMNESTKRFCVDCKATKTPMWRSGPLGPRSLCNACGIRYRKRKMTDDQKPSCSEIRKEKLSTTTSTSNTVDDDDQMNEEPKMGFNHLGNQVIIPRSSSSSSISDSKLMRREYSRSSKSKKKLGEVEEAAVLLMSLSCGSVFA